MANALATYLTGRSAWFSVIFSLSDQELLDVSKVNLGTKRICPVCGAVYYDMGKNPPVCPVCGAVYDPEALLKSRKTRTAPADTKTAAKKPSTKKAKGEEAEVEEVEEDLEAT